MKLEIYLITNLRIYDINARYMQYILNTIVYAKKLEK